jgi:hypothetical protein
MVSDVYADEIGVLDCGAKVIQAIRRLGASPQNVVETL